MKRVMLLNSASPIWAMPPAMNAALSTTATTSGQRRRKASGAVIASDHSTVSQNGASSPYPVVR